MITFVYMVANRQYFIRHLLPTNASIATDKKIFIEGNRPAWGFKYGSNELCFHDTEQGFIVDAIVEASDLEQAIKKAKGAIENTASYVTFASGNMVEGSRFIFGYDVGKNIEKRDFQQEFILPMFSERILDSLKSEEFTEILQAIDSTPHNPEVLRALMFLRYSMKDDLGEIIRFSNLWQGLEVLNEKLMAEFAIADDERWNTCSKCTSRTSPKMSVGIQKLFNDDKTFHSIRRLRGNLMHGKAVMDYDLADECLEKNKILRAKLIEAIALLLKLPAPTRKRLEQVKRKPLTPRTRFVIKAKLLEFTPQPLVNIHQHPYFQLTKADISSTSEDNKQIHSQTMFTVVNGKFTNIETFMWSHDGSENVIKNVDVKLS